MVRFGNAPSDMLFVAVVTTNTTTITTTTTTTSTITTTATMVYLNRPSILIILMYVI
jgi:hypothetical protein